MFLERDFNAMGAASCWPPPPSKRKPNYPWTVFFSRCCTVFLLLPLIFANNKRKRERSSWQWQSIASASVSVIEDPTNADTDARLLRIRLIGIGGFVTTHVALQRWMAMKRRFPLFAFFAFAFIAFRPYFALFLFCQHCQCAMQCTNFVMKVSSSDPDIDIPLDCSFS